MQDVVHRDRAARLSRGNPFSPSAKQSTRGRNGRWRAFASIHSHCESKPLTIQISRLQFIHNSDPVRVRELGGVVMLPSPCTERRQGAHSSARTTWFVSSGVLLLGVIYISSFWGNASDFFPVPLDQWPQLYYRLIGPQWHVQLENILPDYQRHQLFFITQSYLLGLFVPGLALLLLRRPLTSVGLSRPNVLGLRFIGVDLLFSLPFGFWLLWMMGNDFVGLGQYLTSLVAMVPEHFLISGVFVALLLPERQLPCPVPMSAINGPCGVVYYVGSVWRRRLGRRYESLIGMVRSNQALFLRHCWLRFAVRNGALGQTTHHGSTAVVTGGRTVRLSDCSLSFYTASTYQPLVADLVPWAVLSVL